MVIAVTTTNQASAVVASAGTLVFNGDNYFEPQLVTVQGQDVHTTRIGDARFDSAVYSPVQNETAIAKRHQGHAGDTTFSVGLGLVFTEDQYYARYGFPGYDKTVFL